jgi:hypothetical protein
MYPLGSGSAIRTENRPVLFCLGGNTFAPNHSVNQNTLIVPIYAHTGYPSLLGIDPLNGDNAFIDKIYSACCTLPNDNKWEAQDHAYTPPDNLFHVAPPVPAFKTCILALHVISPTWL